MELLFLSSVNRRRFRMLQIFKKRTDLVYEERRAVDPSVGMIQKQFGFKHGKLTTDIVSQKAMKETPKKWKGLIYPGR